MDYIFSQHALGQMKSRDLSIELVENIINNPDEIKQEEGLTIYQCIVPFLPKGNYLVRVFVNTTKMPNLIVTVYKTSKISKYHEGKI
jgi:hypothetical protein